MGFSRLFSERNIAAASLSSCFTHGLTGGSPCSLTAFLWAPKSWVTERSACLFLLQCERTAASEEKLCSAVTPQTREKNNKYIVPVLSKELYISTNERILLLQRRRHAPEERHWLLYLIRWHISILWRPKVNCCGMQRRHMFVFVNLSACNLLFEEAKR